MTNESVGDIAASIVCFAAAVGISLGLVVELGGAAYVDPRWRRLIGMAREESGPARPRFWTLPFALGLFVVVGASVVARLASAIARSDIVGAFALGIGLVAFVAWLVYLGAAGLRRARSL